MLTDAFEAFAHSLRILLEAMHGATELLFVDSHEAAGNIEQGLTQTLNAFHSLYDRANSVPHLKFDWYGTPETATILAIRNARHHNIANRVRGLYTYHLQQPQPERPRPYVFVDYPETEDGGDTFDVPISWHDMNLLLSMPQSDNKLRASAVKGISGYLGADRMNTYATKNAVPRESVFFNVTPLIVNAAKKAVPVIKDHVNPRSLEGRHFLGHFDYVFAADTSNHVVDRFSVLLPG